MNRETPSVPITTLAGTSNLTDLLLEFPLPSNTPDINLIDTLNLQEDTNNLLQSADQNPHLINELSRLFQLSNVDHILLTGDKKVEHCISHNSPYLLRSLASKSPNIFSRKTLSRSFPTPTVNGGVYPPKPHTSPFQAGHISPSTPLSPKRSVTTPSYPQPAATILPSKQNAVSTISPSIIPNLTVKSESVIQNGVPDTQVKAEQDAVIEDVKSFPVISTSNKENVEIPDQVIHREVINPVAEILSKGIKNDLNQTSLERLRILEKKDVRLLDYAIVRLVKLDINKKNVTIKTKQPQLRILEKKDKRLLQIPVVKIERLKDIFDANNNSTQSKIINKNKNNNEESIEKMPSPTDSTGDEQKSKQRHRHKSKDGKKDRYNVVNKESPMQGLTLKLSISKKKDEVKQQKCMVEKSEKSEKSSDVERPSCSERLDPVNGQEQTNHHSPPESNKNSKRKRDTVSYRDNSDSEKTNEKSNSSKREKHHRHHSSDERREKKRKRDHHDKRKSKSSSNRRHHHHRSRSAHKSHRKHRSMTPQTTHTPEPVVYLPSVVPLDDEKCSSRIALGNVEEQLSELGVLMRFNQTMDEMLVEVEDVDLSAIYGHEDDEDSLNDPLVSKNNIKNLLNETSKLNSLAAVNKVPYEKLVRLLALLQFSIKDGCRLNAYKHAESANDRERNKEAMERVLCAADSSLIALNIMTSKDMPKQVYLEDTIERVVSLTKKQLNAIYPEYDSIYRIVKEKKEFDPNLKTRRSRVASTNKSHSTLKLYNKLIDIVRLLAELSKIQELTDTTVLQLSSLSVAPFFVENINELQLSALKLITSIFSHYEKHRQLILEDILSSLSRLSSSKNKLRNYRLNADESIQMVTALALQLIQCVVKLPVSSDDDTEDDSKVDKEVVISNSYETALRTAHTFLCVFLKKCSTKGENDYRPLFENFVYDLLSTVNRPEWPAAELILSLLGRLLVKQFSDKSVDMSLRVASLDYLGIVAARLRKDSITSHHDDKIIKDIVDHEHSLRAESDPKIKRLNETEYLQSALIQYLISSAVTNESVMFSRNFYLAQWFRDCSVVLNNKTQLKSTNTNNKIEEHSSGEEDDDETIRNNKIVQELAKATEQRQAAESHKAFIMQNAQIKVKHKHLRSDNSTLTYEDACMVTRYLAGTRPFSQSFDIYLSQILKVLSETAVAVRTKAMKCLTAVIEADPLILAREDMKQEVQARFHDNSTSVREAAVELIGKFILIRPDLTLQYYDMLSNRILDTGVSVRKRVIRIFRDICLEQPQFPKIPEMCVRMIRRVNDEDGIKKLVNNTFQAMWFSETSEEKSSELIHRVTGITDVVTLCKDYGLDWFEKLLENLLDSDKEREDKPIESACSRVVNCLVNTMLNSDFSSATSSTASDEDSVGNRLVSCFQTLDMFCKVRPNLLTHHSNSIQSYLNIKCTSSRDIIVIQSVSRILEKCVPLMKHPSDVFLETLESSLMNIILRNNSSVLTDSVSCLASIVLKVTFNYKLIKDIFEKFFCIISAMIIEYKKNGASPYYKSFQFNLLRSLYISGLFCRWFNFDDTEKFGQYKLSIRDKIFNSLLYWVSNDNERIRHRALAGLGFFLTRDYEYMLRDDMKNLYRDLLAEQNDVDNDQNVKLRCQVLLNLHMYLQEEENRMLLADIEYKKNAKKEDLKEMGDVQSGMASTVVQLYIHSICESFFHPNLVQRQTTLKVVTLILRQGLVHPVNLVPYLAAVSTDTDITIRSLANQQLNELDKKYPNFIQGKALAGIRESHRLQCILQRKSTLIRGYRIDTESIVVGLNSYIYGLIRQNRNQRRALVQSLLHCFDIDMKKDDIISDTLSKLVYMADVLTSLPFQVHDEPLFVIHQIDLIVSVYGSNVLQQFTELFFPQRGDKFEEEDVDATSLYDHLPDDVEPLCNQLIAAQRCVLLIRVKTHMKETYGFTDAKLQRYSPSEAAKVWDKPLHRKISKNPYEPPECVMTRINEKQLDIIERCNGCGDEAIQTRRSLIFEYLDFKQLMLTIDPDDDDDIDTTVTSIPVVQSVATAAVTTADTEPNYHEDGDHMGALMRPSGLSNQVKTRQRKTAANKIRDTPKKKVRRKKRRFLENEYSDDSNDSDYML